MNVQGFKQALPAALLVHGCRTLCAAFLVAQVLSRRPAARVDDNATVQTLLALLHVFDGLAELSVRSTLIPIAIVLITGPFWRVFWLCATARRDRLEAHARCAAARYRAALVVTLACAGYAAGLLLIGVGAGLAVARLCAPLADVRAQALLSIAAASPFVIAVLYPATLVDLAHAALAQGASGVGPALRAARAEQSLHLMLSRAGFGFSGIVVTVVSALAARSVFGVSPAGSMAALVVTQLAALAASCLRGAWFAMLIDSRERAQLGAAQAT